MQMDEPQDQERRESIEELSGMLLLAQEMGRRLANETHGASYQLVLDLNELLHQARKQIELIQANASGA